MKKAIKRRLSSKTGQKGANRLMVAVAVGGLGLSAVLGMYLLRQNTNSRSSAYYPCTYRTWIDLTNNGNVQSYNGSNLYNHLYAQVDAQDYNWRCGWYYTKADLYVPANQGNGNFYMGGPDGQSAGTVNINNQSVGTWYHQTSKSLNLKPGCITSDTHEYLNNTGHNLENYTGCK